MQPDQKLRASNLRSRRQGAYLATRDTAAFVIDPDRRLMLAATALAARLWGLPGPPDTAPIPLDAAMPAMATLSGLYPAGKSRRAIDCQLDFWTALGPRRWRCRVTRFANGRAANRALLVTPELDGEPVGLWRGAGPLAILAHELRTPLAAIQAFAELILEPGPHGPDSRRHRDYVRNIHEAARHGLAVVASLADPPSPLSPRPAEPARPIALAEILASALRTLNPLAARAGARIAVTDNSPGIEVRIDPLALMQILINLVGNAIRHAGPAAHITIRVGRPAAGHAEVEITDAGPGYPAAVVARIMASASPADDGLTRAGLGLTLSAELAATAGGRLEIGNPSHGGAQARLLLPVAREPRSARPRGFIPAK